MILQIIKFYSIGFQQIMTHRMAKYPEIYYSYQFCEYLMYIIARPNPLLCNLKIHDFNRETIGGIKFYLNSPK